MDDSSPFYTECFLISNICQKKTSETEQYTSVIDLVEIFNLF